jgi:hypothetical protein
VPQVGADGVRLAVDQLGGQLQVVEALVPELPLGRFARRPASRNPSTAVSWRIPAIIYSTQASSASVAYPRS